MDDAERARLRDPATDETIYAVALELGASQVAELRAVLAGLLDRWELMHNPTLAAFQISECVFCRAQSGQYADPPLQHAPGCAVLRRDDLLGRR